MGGVNSTDNGDDVQHTGHQEEHAQSAVASIIQHETHLADVLILLANIQDSNIKVPLNLMVDIINYAGVLPSLYIRKVTKFSSGDNCNVSYLDVPLPRSPYLRAASIHITMRSKDQGWSSYPREHGTRTSHTWGELALSSNPDVRYPFFRNLHAGKAFETHEKEISVQSGEESMSAEDGALLREIERCIHGGTGVGDVGSSGDEAQATLRLMVRSQYPAWRISVESAEVALRCELGGDWSVFEQWCAQRRGR